MIDRVILITGDRLWTDIPAIRRKLEPLDIWHTAIIHGCATGADSAASLAALQLGIPQIKVPYFSRFGRAGGPIRNQVMLDILKGFGLDSRVKIEVWAFHDDLEHSKGTKDMVRRARKAGVEVKHYKHGKR